MASETARSASPAQKATVSRRLIVNADDFGRSNSINAAVVRAHREGILASASLMVNEAAFEQAVQLARENPELGIGLHLSLLCGRAALPPQSIPGLINSDGQFGNNPGIVGARYFFHRGLRKQLRAEIHAQFTRFRETGLPLDHVNGHLHLHLHPTILSILLEDAAQLGLERVRLTHDPFWLNLRLARGRLFYRMLHAGIYFCLARRARPVFALRRLKHTRAVFGLLQNGCVDETYVLRLLRALPEGDSELYSHPSLDEFRNEFEALVSPRVVAEAARLGVQLVRYQDL